MIKKTVTYTDYNDVETTETFCFNMRESEIADLELRYEGGIAQHTRELVKNEDVKGLMDFYKTLIIASYGKVSDDGRKFYKTEEYAQDFISSPAFDEIYGEILSDDTKAKEFLIGILPSKHTASIKEKMDKLTEDDMQKYIETGKLDV